MSAAFWNKDKKVPNIELQTLTDIVVKVFENSNTTPENAAVVADALVKAEADGLASHGLSRVASYADQALTGKVDGNVLPVLNQTGTAAASVNAKNGFAYPAINMGLAWAIDHCFEAGIVGVGISNSHHSGVAGHHVETLANAGFMALGFTNSPAGISPWGGNRALYGTNPIAFACPRSDNEPLVVDLSMSKVARGKIKLAADNGDPIPEGWAVDVDGQPTTDASAAMAGTMLPMGDAKGAALTLVVEMLAATLTGSNHGFEASPFFGADGPPPGVGQFFIAMNPPAFAGDAFADRAEVLLAAILEQPGTRLPGQRRFDNRASAASDGIDVSEALYDDLKKRTGG
jgi:(2R)-3-sulfolactate dehydrogenase (NADP+)